MKNGSQLVSKINELQDKRKYQELSWEGTLEEYLDFVVSNPKVARNSYQRLYDMIVSYGQTEYNEYKKKITRFKFFDDPLENGKDSVFGIDLHLMKLVRVFKSAALGYGTEKRIVLLHGPVGSAKSTVARMLKKGLINYTKSPEGAIYTFYWTIENAEGKEEVFNSPMNEDPLCLIPAEMREQIFEEINANLPEDMKYKVKVHAELCPASRYIYNDLMKKYDGDWSKVIKHVKVKRFVFSEDDRIGIGTFQPKDEKNQDSTELTGDINYRKIAEYGSDSDPRAFNFDGEFNIANRGLIEFIEILKLDVAFLYDLLGASQERKIKPKKFAQTDIDEVIIGHTNEPEYKKLQNNEFMEALRDRTIKIDIPYITKLKDEIRIYERDFSSKKIKKHIAPHTIEVAAMWAVLTRLEQPKKANLTMLQKLKLYNGQSVTGYTEDNVKELRKEAVREGLQGISARYIQDKISNALVSELEEDYINPFMVMSELESGLKHHSLISNEEDKARYKELLAVVREEYENIIKSEVQRAISADEEGVSQLCGNYIDNIKAYTLKEKIRNKYTGRDEEADERLMRSIEEKIEIPENRKDDFRREIMNYIGALAVDGKVFSYSTNARLQKALELKLFEDKKDSIKLTSLVSNAIDEKTQKQIDIVKGRLIKNYGYTDASATDILNYVASIFARGDAK
ncbi:MAG: serine protein kinase [Cyanobacteriota bacterium]